MYYTATDLGTLSDSPLDQTEPSDISEGGIVVGRTLNGNKGRWTAFLYDPVGGIWDLGAQLIADLKLDESLVLGSLANKVNANKIVVGTITTTAGYIPLVKEEHAFLYDPAKGSVDLHTDFLGPHGFADSQAFGINLGGEVIGSGKRGEFRVPWLLDINKSLLVVLSDENTWPGGVARDISDGRQIAGGSSVDEDQTGAFVYDLNKKQASVFGPQRSRAEALNETLQVVGTKRPTLKFNKQAFYYPATVGVGDFALGVSEAVDVNLSGQVVGNVFGDKPYPFLAQLTPLLDVLGQSPVAPIDLNTLLAPLSENWQLQNASAINDDGYIVGWGLLSGQQRGFLLRPFQGFQINSQLPPLPVTSPDWRILFGQSQQGVGRIVLPGGTILNLPAGLQQDQVYRAFAKAMEDMLPGLAVRQIALAGNASSRRTLEQTGFDLIEQATRELLRSLELLKGGLGNKE